MSGAGSCPDPSSSQVKSSQVKSVNNVISSQPIMAFRTCRPHLLRKGFEFLFGYAAVTARVDTGKCCPRSPPTDFTCNQREINQAPACIYNIGMAKTHRRWLLPEPASALSWASAWSRTYSEFIILNTNFSLFLHKLLVFDTQCHVFNKNIHNSHT